MIVEYSSPRVRAYFEDTTRIERVCGKQMAKKLYQRYMELSAYPHLKALYVEGLGRPHKLKGNLDDYIALTLDDRVRLLIEWPKNTEEHDFLKVNRVYIKGVCDYHGGKIIKWLIP